MKNDSGDDSNLGFKQKMPDDWEDNAFARYEEAGIKLV